MVIKRKKYGAGGAIGGSIGALAGSFIPIPGVGTAIGTALGTAAGNYVEKQIVGDKQDTPLVTTNNNINSQEDRSLDFNPYGNSFAGGGNLNNTNNMYNTNNSNVDYKAMYEELLRKTQQQKMAFGGDMNKLAFGNDGGKTVTAANAEGTQYSARSPYNSGVSEFDTKEKVANQYMQDDANFVNTFKRNESGSNTPAGAPVYNPDSWGLNVKESNENAVETQKVDPNKWQTKRMLMPNGREKTIKYKPATGEILTKRVGSSLYKPLRKGNLFYSKDSDAQGVELTQDELAKKVELATTYEETVNEDGRAVRRYGTDPDNYEYYVKDPDKKKWKPVENVSSRSRYASSFGGRANREQMGEMFNSFGNTSNSNELSSSKYTGRRTGNMETK